MRNSFLNIMQTSIAVLIRPTRNVAIRQNSNRPKVGEEPAEQAYEIEAYVHVCEPLAEPPVSATNCLRPRARVVTIGGG
jgi:hypothetical protein